MTITCTCLQSVWHLWWVLCHSQQDHMSCHRLLGDFEPKWMCSSLTPSSSAICRRDWDRGALWHKDRADFGKQIGIYGLLSLYLTYLEKKTNNLKGTFRFDWISLICFLSGFETGFEQWEGCLKRGVWVRLAVTLGATPGHRSSWQLYTDKQISPISYTNKHHRLSDLF